MRTLQTIISIALISTMNLFAGESTQFKADINETKLKWIGEKVSGEHYGHVTLKSGEAVFNDKGELIGGNFVVDMTSLTVEDLEPGKWHDKLKGHLKSDDFFSVDKHKEAIFVITHVKNISDNKSKITGNLTIKDITKQITFEAEHKVQGDKFMADAKLEIDRTKFDIKYNSGNFFENLGDKLIYDDFVIDLKLVAKK